MLELGITLVIVALALLTVAVTAKGIPYRQRGKMSLIAAALSFSGMLLSFFSR